MRLYSDGRGNFGAGPKPPWLLSKPLARDAAQLLTAAASCWGDRPAPAAAEGESGAVNSWSCCITVSPCRQAGRQPKCECCVDACVTRHSSLFCSPLICWHHTRCLVSCLRLHGRQAFMQAAATAPVAPPAPCPLPLPLPPSHPCPPRRQEHAPRAHLLLQVLSLCGPQLGNALEHCAEAGHAVPVLACR